MNRTQDPTAQANKHGASKSGFTEGSPGVTPPTRIRATDLDAFQEEIVRTIEAEDITPSAADIGQLNQAIDLKIVRANDLASLTTLRKVREQTGPNKAMYGVVVGANGTMVAFGEGVLLYKTLGGAWTAATDPLSGTGPTYYACVWDAVNSLFILVGSNFEGGIIETSPDGATWTTRISGDATDLYDVCTDGAGNSVAVGLSDRIYSSSNGTTWTSRTSAYSGSTNHACAFGAGLLVVFASGGKAQSSPDGITWTARTTDQTSPFPDLAQRCLKYSARWGFVCLGKTANDDIFLYTSTDGITWTRTAHSSESAAGMGDQESAVLLLLPESVVVLTSVSTGTDATIVHSVASTPTYANAARIVHYLAPFGALAAQLINDQLWVCGEDASNGQVYCGAVQAR